MSVAAFVAGLAFALLQLDSEPRIRAGP